MDALFKAGKATALEVQSAIPDPPSYSAVRATLRILEEKGFVRHEDKDGKYIYSPKTSRESARRSALRRLLDTFFEGSAAEAAAALLGSSSAKFTEEDLDRLSALVEKAKKEKRS